jgi:hypothetical protein
MRKSLIALASAALVAGTALTAPTAAEAQWRRGGGAAVLGGLAAGAIIGGALAAPYYYGGGPSYGRGYYRGGYYAAGEPVCTIRRQRFWDGYGWRVRRVEVC